MYTGLHVKYLLSFSNFNETLTFSTDVQKYLNTKFHENSPCESQVVPHREMDRQTFHSFANTPRYVLFSVCTDQWLLTATSGAQRSNTFPEYPTTTYNATHSTHCASHNGPKVESLCTDH